MFGLIYTLFGYEEKPKDTIKKCIITPNDLQKVILKPSKIQAAFARNLPKNSYKIVQLTKEQLQDIIHNTLKPTPKIEKKKYTHRHPVLRELLQKTQIIL